MRFHVPLALVATAAATRQPPSKLIPRQVPETITFEEANSACSSGQAVSCCSVADESGETQPLLHELLGAGHGECFILGISGRS